MAQQGYFIYLHKKNLLLKKGDLDIFIPEIVLLF